MPSDNTRNTMLRQWELLKLLPGRRPGKTTSELTKELDALGFSVTKRTVERDLENLSEVFSLDRNDKSIPYGWYWAPGTSADLPGITLAEALSLQMVEETIKPLLPSSVISAIEPRFRQAANKLASQKKNIPSIARWADKVRNIPPSLPLLPPKVDPEVLENVQAALLNEVQLEVDYQSMSAEAPSSMTIHPLAMVQRGPVTYLIATVYNYGQIRLLVLHRISRAEQLAARIKPPKDFDVDRYIQSGGLQFGNGELIRLKAIVDQQLARILEETPLSEDQKLTEEDGRFLLSVTVTDSWQLQWWILSQGPSIVVTSPSALRKKIANALIGAGKQYI